MGPTHAVPPPGLERAPPRLIPGEDDRCFPLFAVASPLIPEGGVTTSAAPLLVTPSPSGLIVRDTWSAHSARPLWEAPYSESFTGVMVRAVLDQGRGVLSRVTSASMLMLITLPSGKCFR